jgi:hypothetical protein
MKSYYIPSKARVFTFKNWLRFYKITPAHSSQKSLINLSHGIFTGINVSEEKRLQTIVKKVMKHIQNGPLCHAFDLLHQMDKDQQRQKDVCTRIVLHMFNSTLSKSFFTWHDNTVELRKKVQIVCVCTLCACVYVIVRLCSCPYVTPPHLMYGSVKSRTNPYSYVWVCVFFVLSKSFLNWHDNTIEVRKNERKVRVWEYVR